MDNDNKIAPKNTQRHDEVLLFLNEELNNLQDDSSTVSYNLETEYAKTKKHHNKSILLILCSSFAFVIILAFLTVSTLTRQNNKITISLDSFADLNLKSLIDSVSTAQTNYENAVKAKARLEAARDTELKTAESKKADDIYILDSMRLRSKSDYNARLQKINTSYKEEIDRIHSEYDEELAVAETEITLYQEQLQKFDAAKVQAAQEQQQALASERELRLLEQKKITEKYEAQIAELQQSLNDLGSKNSVEIHKVLRDVTAQYEEEIKSLDPVLDDQRAYKILTRLNVVELSPWEKESLEASASDDLDGEAPFIVPEITEPAETVTEGVADGDEDASAAVEEQEIVPPVILKDYDFNTENFISDNSIKSEGLINKLNDYKLLMEDYAYLENTINELPYKNSVLDYVKASRILVGQMSETLASGSVDLAKENQKLEEKNNQLKKESSKQKKEISRLEELRISDKKELRESYEATFEGLLTVAKAGAVILSASSADNIKVYVALKSREQIPEGGMPAEIRGAKPVKGKIIKSDDTTYIFQPGVDKNGNPVEVDLGAIPAGTVVRLLAK